jgi:hypothetical protein
MPKKQIGFQNPKYETYRFIFNYIWEDNEELIQLSTHSCTFNNEKEEVKMLEYPKQQAMELFKIMATAHFFKGNAHKRILDYNVSCIMEISSKSLNNSARGHKIYIEEL